MCIDEKNNCVEKYKECTEYKGTYQYYCENLAKSYDENKKFFMKMINVFPNIYIAKVIKEMIEPFVSLLFHMINQMENLWKIIINVLWKLMVVK